MKFSKMKTKVNERTLVIGKEKIPFSFIGAVSLFVLFILICYFAYDIGRQDAEEILKWSSKLNPNGVYIQETNKTMFCTQELENKVVTWDCIYEEPRGGFYD